MKMIEEGTARRRKGREGECVVVAEVRRTHQWEENYTKGNLFNGKEDHNGKEDPSLFGSDWTELLASYFWTLPLLDSPWTSSPLGTATLVCTILFNIRNSTLQDKGSSSSKFGI